MSLPFAKRQEVKMIFLSPFQGSFAKDHLSVGFTYYYLCVTTSGNLLYNLHPVRNLHTRKRCFTKTHALQMRARGSAKTRKQYQSFKPKSPPKLLNK